MAPENDVSCDSGPSQAGFQQNHGDGLLYATAMLHAPGVSDGELCAMAEKLRAYIQGLHLTLAQEYVNPSRSQWNKFVCKDDNSILVVGWGLEEKPNWNKWVRSHAMPHRLANIIGVDLSSMFDSPDSNCAPLIDDFDIFWSLRVKRWDLLRFMHGIYVCKGIPFGFETAPHDGFVQIVSTRGISENKVLKPGKTDEVEIVRLIFKLHGLDGYPRAEIANLLNAERIPAPKQARAWIIDRITRMLTDPIYMGCNRFAGLVRPGAFTPIVSYELFELAQQNLEKEFNSNRRLYLGRKPAAGNLSVLPCESACATTESAGAEM